MAMSLCEMSESSKSSKGGQTSIPPRKLQRFGRPWTAPRQKETIQFTRRCGYRCAGARARARVCERDMELGRSSRYGKET